LCPHLNLVRGHYDQYGVYSRRVMAILAQAGPVVEQMSIDEAYVDLTGDPKPGGEVAQRLKRRIREETGLPVSFGVATNKLVAKIATNVGKPDGLVVVPPGHEADFLAPLPLEMLWGVGPKTRARLIELGIKTIGQLAAWPAEDLERRFGEWGRQMVAHARGVDQRPVSDEREAKSISAETTFARDVADRDTLRRKLLALAEEVGAGLRADGLSAKTVKLKVRWPPFETHTRQVTLSQPVQLDDEIFAAGWALFEQVWHPGKRVRLIGIGVSGLDQPARQLSIFDSGQAERKLKVAKVVDALRDKYGADTLQRAALLRRKKKTDE
jgi:DNA polymerase-4